MATVKDILGTDSLKFENEFKAQGLSGDRLESAMIKLARDTRTQRETQQKQTQEQTQEQRKASFELNPYNKEGFGNSVVSGMAEATARGIAFGNYLGVVPDDFAKKNAQILDDLEKRKELDSNRNIKFDLDEVKKDIQDYKSNPVHTQMEQQQYAFDLERLSSLEQRPAQKEALKQESSNAKGFGDNAIVGIKTLVDTAMHPAEWTTQGIVAGVLPSDPANALSLITAGIGGKLTLALGGKLLARTSVGVADGIAVGAGMEYAVAKGTFKSDEEAKKAAIQGGIASGVIPAAYGAIGANADSVIPKTITPLENKPQISEIQKKEAYSNVFSSPFLKNQETNRPLTSEETSLKLEDGFSGEIVDDAKKETLVKSELDKENINMIKNIAQAEQDSNSFHENTKLKLQEAMNNGASIDEMMAIRNNIEITDSEAMISKIINNDEPTTNRLAGFRIVSVIEDTIRNSKLTPDEVKQKLINENVNPDLATVATKSYILKKTDILIDFIQNKVDAHLDTTHTNLKKDIETRVDLYNKQKIADEELWTNSITKKSLDEYISKEIGDDNISVNQRDLIQELNKIGLVEDVVSAKLKNNINGQYDMSNNNITLNNSIPNIQKAQVLTHEYLHSALGRLIENKKFNDELTFLMTDAKKEFKANKKDVNQYGFTNIQDFAAEAFSNPYLARDLNEVKLSADAKVKLGVKEYINTLWEAIVTKFNDVIFESTGRRIKLNPDSYYGALNSMIDRELTHLQNIKEQRLNDGTALESNLKPAVEIKPTLFDNLKLHPRYEELLSMREDVKATDIKYENKVLNKGTVVHDENKFGGVDKTQVVPTSYERNYNADFKLTKQDVENIKTGKIDEKTLQKLTDDLSTLDNHPDWKKYSDDIDVNQSKDILGQEFNDNHYINKNGELVDNGKVLFSKSDIKEKNITALEDMRNEIEYHKLTDEEQSIYDVYMGKRSVAEIKSNDLKDVILLEKGSRRTGARKIEVVHGGVDKKGGLTHFEMLKLGEVIRKGIINSDSFTETKDSIRYGYDYKTNDINFRAIVEEFNDGRKVINYYSDRNFVDYENGIARNTGSASTMPLDKNIIANNKENINENFPMGKSKESNQDIKPNTLYNTENNIGKKMGLLERIAAQRESVGLPKEGRIVYHPTKDKNYFLSNDGRVFAEKSNGKWKETPNIDTINDIKFISEKGVVSFKENLLSSAEKNRKETLQLQQQQAKDNENYQMQHKAPTKDDGTRADDVTEVFSNDIYSNDAIKLLGGANKIMAAESINIIKNIRKKPDSNVKIYRAVPNKLEVEINPNDWVTTSKTYAKEHGENALKGDYKILEKTVKAKDLYTDGNSIHEWGYSPDDSSSKILYSKNFTGKNKTLPEQMDALSDKAIDKLDNLFKGLTPEGKLKPQTNPLMDIFRTLLVPDAHKQKQFVELLRNNNKEKARQKIIARKLQEDLNTIPKKENELLVMALDGDIAKEDIRTTLGDELYGHYEVMRKQIDDNANELVKLGMLDEASKKEDYIKRFYKEHLESKGVIAGLFRSGHKLDKNFKRKDLTKEQRDKLNQVRDAGYVVARTLLEQNNQIRKAKFLNTLADEFSVNEERVGFVQVPLKKDGSISVFGNLSGKYVPEHIMNELNGLYEFGKSADNIVQENVKNFSRWLKGTWTAGNPSTHLYNVGSNMINLYLNGHLFTIKNGRTFGGSKGIEGLKKFFSEDTREAYKKELTEAGLYDDSFFTTLESLVDDLDVKTKDNWSMKDIYNGVLFKKDSKITKAVENVYDLEDKIFRIFVYEEQKWDAKVEKYKKEFGKIDSWSEAREKIEAIELDSKEKLEAMNEARDTFVDYSKPVPNWIQVADNYMVAPFARYTYLATIRQSKVAIKHPLRALALSFGFGEALKEIFGDEDENLDDKDPLKPDWMKTSASNFNMYGVQNFTKLGDTKDEASYFNTGRLIPGFRMFEATLGFYAELIDTIKDKENKFGQKFVQEHNTKLEVLAKTLSKTSEMILPPLFPIAVPVPTMWNQPRLTEGGNIKKDKDGNPMTETVVVGGRYGQKLMGAASGSSLDRYGQPVPPTDVIKQMLGIKMQTINKKDEASRQLLSLEKKYKPEIQREKSLGNPKAQKEKQEEYTKKVQEIKKAAPGFDLGNKSKKNDNFNVKFDF